LDEHPETAKEIETKVYAVLGIGRDLVKPIEAHEPSAEDAAPVPAATPQIGNGAGAVEAVGEKAA
jgi:hypothetical protein